MASDKPTLTALPVEIQTMILLNLRHFYDQVAPSQTCRLWQEIYLSHPRFRRARYPADGRMPDYHKLLNYFYNFYCTLDPATGTVSSYELSRNCKCRSCYDHENCPPPGNIDISSCAFLDDPLFSPFEPYSPFDVGTYEKRLHDFYVEFSGGRIGLYPVAVCSETIEYTKATTVREFITGLAAKARPKLQAWATMQRDRSLNPTITSASTLKLRLHFHADCWAQRLQVDLTLQHA
ncbi:hypothetical protein Dda_4338 [Drechslerella dactyloides]|uniref:F-box domain-containing protein n=1 Tax=Drechslerella dactyloides TaxID=74499 RepID=A0AAD6IXE4_DREDA|nr:hypothetical protein Dda_4338 [Drechslerella dactyloides]